ncbi:uncharacterized protein F5891DRAFT_1211218 [Suillus fuscotomentosus]|uniref:Uncharacterized protein n=1 Tax=Suillus fuscotomentosus TaxID=1912939 RepID=A0AAD4HDH0_9AGAM|nr:uncharacterized protein F5891DRAFT_1211218 [Suillus fuscotomentosus]KAG1891642.1 hypothetical protein F5891DRAFT_1211218 [Suillus fuscotomentosus]
MAAVLHGPTIPTHPSPFQNTQSVSHLRMGYHPEPSAPPNKPQSTQPMTRHSDPFYGHEQVSQLFDRFIMHLFACPEYPPSSSVTFTALVLLQQLKPHKPSTYHKSLPASSSHFGPHTFAFIWPSPPTPPGMEDCIPKHEPVPVPPPSKHNLQLSNLLYYVKSSSSENATATQHPIAHHDSESELEYDDASESDVLSSYVAGTTSITTQSLASLQGGDMEIIWCLQLENQSLKNNNWMLGEKNKVLASNQHRCSSAQVPDELKAFDIELSTFACKYGIIAEMFPPEHHILRLPVPNPPPVIISPSHYSTKGAKELCLVTELYSLLPDHLHHFIPTSHFQSLLEQHLEGEHSSEIGKLRLMAGHIFGLDSSYFDLSFMKQDTIPEIQKMLGSGTAGGRSLPSKFPPILFTNQEMDPTMSTVFGNWEQLMKAIRIMMFRKNSLVDVSGWPRTKCNARKWGTMSCTPGLLAWGWVALIFILSSDTLFRKAGVGAKSQLPYAAMFMAYKQLLMPTSGNHPQLPISQHLTLKVFTSDLMCLAITNAGHKESDDFPGPMTTNDNPVNDIPGPAMPTTPMIAPSAPVIVPLAPAIVVLVPANATTTLNPATLLPAIPAPGPPVASEFAAYEDSVPSVMAVDSEVPGVPGDVPVVVTAPSSGCRGRGRKAGMLAPVSSGPAIVETQLGYLDKPWNLDLKVPENQLGQLQPTVNIANLVET